MPNAIALLAEKLCLADRGAAFENAWEAAWACVAQGKTLDTGPLTYIRLITESSQRFVDCLSGRWRAPEPSDAPPNPLAVSFLDLWRPVQEGRGWVPMLLLNATHEERGKRVITSNVQRDRQPVTDA